MEPISLYEFEALAKERMDPHLWDYVEAGAGDQVTLHRNRAAFDEITVNPRFLVDVNNRDLSTTVLGQKISFPVMVTPAGGQRHVHAEGEQATARAAGAAGTLMALPSNSGYSIEEVAEVATGPLWFQLSHFGDEVTELLVTRAEAAGYRAICYTVDSPVPSIRERDLRNRFSGQGKPSWGNLRGYPDVVARNKVLTGYMHGNPDAAAWTPPTYVGLTWSRLGWLRSLTGLPLVIKGIGTAADALLCVEHGVDGIVVSNHGARHMDGTLSSIEALPAIYEAVGDRLEVYLDSGVRRGLDVLRALALGARAVLIGRPVFWGLAVNGEHGVRRVLEILRAEFDRAIAYCGRTCVADIDESLISFPRR